MTETMSAAEYQATTDEASFQAAIVDLAHRYGWRAHFLPDWLYRLALREVKRRPRSGYQWPDKGFCDLVLCRERINVAPIQCLVIEVKVGRNKPTAEQRWWMGCLLAVGMDVRTWRPEDWDIIEETLR